MPTDDPTTVDPPGASRPPIRRLTRSRRDKVVAGVAGGLGEYLGVDPVIIRIAFVALAVAGGSGVVLYVLGWLLLPEEGSSATPGAAAFHSLFHRRPVLAIILCVVGVGLLFDDDHHHNEFGWAAALIAVGAVILLSQRRREGTGTGTGTDEPPATPAPSDPGPVAEARAELDDLDPPPMWPPVTATPAPPKPRPFLTPVTISLLLIGAGLASLLGISLQAFLAGALIFVGLVLLVGSRVGQARGLVVVGLLLAAAATAASVTDISFRGGVGDREYRPATASQLEPSYRLGVGELNLDLSDLELTRDRRVRVRIGVGSLQVVVPDDVTVRVDAHAGLGEVTVFGRHDEGGDVDVSATNRADTETARELVLDLDAGIGEIDVEVERAAA